jgi:hypothetical protein
MNTGWKPLKLIQGLALLALVLWTWPLQAGSLTQRLTKAEVDCNARQLDRLLARVSTGVVNLQPFQPPKIVIVSYSNKDGFYEGLAFTNQDWRRDPFTGLPPPTPERELAFHLNPSIRRLLLNPARPPVGQVSLGREQASSEGV